ncbi:MAG: helix-turn-helix transcriptional regulator [Nitrospinales bacterium]
MCKYIPAWDLIDSRKDTVALPFCHFALKTQNLTSKTNYPNELNTLGDHIRKRRLDLELLQKDVAGIIGVTSDTIYNWENNRFQPHIRLISEIMTFLEYCPWPARFN